MSKVTFFGNELVLAQKELYVGDKAPKVNVAGKDLNDITVGGSSDKVQILISVPSLDTPVCAAEARKFNEKIAKNPNIKLTIISMDLPFAMDRFCTAEGIENLTIGSDFKDRSFGKNYSVLVEKGPIEGLLARAVFIIDKDGTIIYKQLVSEVSNEPNYDEITKFLADNQI